MDYKRDEIKDHFYEWKKHQSANWIIDNMDDLHHECFNTDYYIIGTQKAIDWMGTKSWDIINHIKNYEQDNYRIVTGKHSWCKSSILSIIQLAL